MSSRRYEGPALDATGQHITEAPYWQADGETVEVTPDDQGEESVEDVPAPAELVESPETDGQSTWDDWGWSN